MEPASALAPDEIDKVVALWGRCGLIRPWNDPFADARLALKGPASTILAIRDGGELMASAMVGHNGHRAYAYYVAVDPGHRRHDLGRAIMTACEDWAREHDMPKLQILVRNENIVATGFYGALGYERDEVVALGKWLNGGGPQASRS